MRTLFNFLLAGATLCAVVAPVEAAPLRSVEVIGPRVFLHDVAPDAARDGTDLDLGPVPAPGGSRLIDAADLDKALQEVPAKETSAKKDGAKNVARFSSVRVVRKMKKLSGDELSDLVRTSLAKTGLPKGATLAGIRAPIRTEIPDGWTRVAVELPAPPRRSGAFPTTASVTLFQESLTTAKLNVPVDLTLSLEAALPDVARGASLQLLIRRGAIEVSAPAMAGADGDLGAILPVVLRPSGRVVRARLIEKERALAIDTP